MRYRIEEKEHEYEGQSFVDLVLTFENGKAFTLVPLTKKDNKRMVAYFYALLKRRATK